MVLFGEIVFDYILERLITWQLQGNGINIKRLLSRFTVRQKSHVAASSVL